MTSSAEQFFKTGGVRSALFLPQYSIDARGEMLGHGTGYIGIAMTRLIADRLGIESEVKGLPSPPAVMDALLAGTIDMAFFGIEPGRQAKADFTPPLFQFDYTYLVPAGSPVVKIADADRAGTRIAIMDSHASALALKLIIKHATIVSAASSSADPVPPVSCRGLLASSLTGSRSASPRATPARPASAGI